MQGASQLRTLHHGLEWLSPRPPHPRLCPRTRHPHPHHRCHHRPPTDAHSFTPFVREHSKGSIDRLDQLPAPLHDGGRTRQRVPTSSVGAQPIPEAASDIRVGHQVAPQLHLLSSLAPPLRGGIPREMTGIAAYTAACALAREQPGSDYPSLWIQSIQWRLSGRCGARLLCSVTGHMSGSAAVTVAIPLAGHRKLPGTAFICL